MEVKGLFGKIKKLISRLKDKPSNRMYVLHPQIDERTDGKMVRRVQYHDELDKLVYDVWVRCESPHPDGSGDFCVNFPLPNEVCTRHWCLRADRKGRIYGHHWTDEEIWDYERKDV